MYMYIHCLFDVDVLITCWFFHLKGGGISGGDVACDIAREAKKVNFVKRQTQIQIV